MSGEEPPETLLDSEAVANTTLDILASASNGQVIDVRLGQSRTGTSVRTEADLISEQVELAEAAARTEASHDMDATGE